MIYFSDVDIALKLAAWGVLDALPDLLGVDANPADIQYLPSLRYRTKGGGGGPLSEAALAGLKDFCAKYRPVSGASSTHRQEELITLGLDAGEAQLFAEAECTGGIVVTGDKRALKAYAKSPPGARSKEVRVVCLEQLLLRAIVVLGFEPIREGCCRDLSADGVVRLAFSNGLATTEETVREALHSYLAEVRRTCGDLLAILEC